jgi:sugar O-acyltransferase (sialic acid O-acetyltransferase NeuD family)
MRPGPVKVTRIRRAVLWGATGQARVLRECLSHQGIAVEALFDNDAGAVSPFADVPLHHGVPGFEGWLGAKKSRGAIGFLVAVGGTRGRDRLTIGGRLEAAGLQALIAIHPTAFVAESASLGFGAQILAQSAVCADAQIGRATIVNTAASVDHECLIGDGVHICPGAHLAGCVVVEDLAMIGTGAIVLPQIRIGAAAVVGAGAVVTRDVPAGAVVAGNPARKVKRGAS